MSRKLFYQILLASVVIIMSLVFTGCGNDDDAPPPPPPPSTPYLTQIRVDPATVSGPIPVDVTQQFTATGTYSDNSVEDLSTSVAWISSAPATASVDGNGLATGEAVGTANITASASGLTSNSVELEVINPTLLSITVAPATVPNPLAVGRSMRFQAEGVFDNTKSYDITSYVTWASSAQAVATIDLTGLATAANAGTTDISASASAVTSNVVELTTEVLVQDSLIIEPQNFDALPINRQQQFVALLRYADGTLQNVTDTAEWTSSDDAVADVGSSVPGMVRGISIGSATITARDATTGVENTLVVEVSDVTLETVTVFPENPVDLPVGNTQPFTATGTFSDGVTRILKGTGSWSVSNNAASITPLTESEGISLVTGLAAGDVWVVYTDFGADGTPTGIEGESQLTVTGGLLQSIEIWPYSAQSLAPENSVQFTAYGTYAGGDDRDITNDVIWESSDTAVGVFDIETKGKLTILPGATAGSFTNATARMLNTDNPPVLLTSVPTQVAVNDLTLHNLRISPTNMTVVMGETAQYTAWGILTDESEVDYTDRVTWSSDEPEFATVSNSAGTEGQVTGVSVGAATIRIVEPKTGIPTSTEVYVVQE